MTKEKKRILYVDREYPAGHAASSIERQRDIIRLLREEFEVDIAFNLNPNIISMIDVSFSEEKPYAALITHVPFGRFDNLGVSKLVFYFMAYRRAFEILEEIRKRHTSFPIIVHTGADIEEIKYLLVSRGIDRIVKKTKSWEEDFDNIKRHLDDLLGEN